MIRISAAMLIVFAANPVYAQIYGRSAPRDPAIWISGGVAAFNADGINDGATRSSWDFTGTHIQYRASLEKSIQNQSSIGITAGYLNLPFTYYGQGLSTASCTRCNAHMKLYSAALSLHVGGGTGFHQVLEATAGANFYRDLKRDDNGAALAPVDGNVDPAFTFGYGFGYNFGLTQELFLIQDYGIAFHEKDGLQNSQNNTLTMRTTRIGYRLGLGARGPLR